MDRQRTVLSKQSKTTLSLIGIIIFLALLGFFSSPLRNPSPTRPAFSDSKMGIIHIVMFEFKQEATEAEITDVGIPNHKYSTPSIRNHAHYLQTCDRMLALKDQCLHPTSKTPYVKSGIGGKQSSPEGKTVCSTVSRMHNF
jgi:hypothetical protein